MASLNNAQRPRTKQSSVPVPPSPTVISAPKWNAAALLNPKAAFGKSQRNDIKSAPQIKNQAAPQMAFSFDSPGGSPGSAPKPRDCESMTPQDSSLQQNCRLQEQSDGVGGHGMGSMLERMHGVKERDLAPTPKRRRVDADTEEERQKATFSGGGKGGVLGEYVKEKREEGRKEAAVNGTAPAVDLTNKDDDDMVMVPSADDREVCYGRVEGADINAFKIPTPRPGATSINNSYWPQVKVVLKRRDGDRTMVIHVVDSTRTVIGCLDVNTSFGLVPLLDSRLSMRTSARILTRQKKPDDLAPGSDCSCRFNLDLTLYGPKKVARQVGVYLSQKQLYLRTPLFVEAGAELFNPQIQFSTQLPRPAKCSGYGGNSASFNPRTVEEVRNDVMDMFDSLEKSENLQEMEADPRITTELLTHQKQGLYFMTSKEKERVFGKDENDNSSLWRLKIGNNGAKSYLNVITGQEEKSNPPQVLGGILADMMGLGKTLSILSLVISTLEYSEIWGSQKPFVDVKDDLADPVRNCKTTLLVSPLSTITNWEDQIRQHVKPGTLNYHIYHGPNRIKDIDELAKFDVVITTYGSVASEYNKRQKQHRKDDKFPLEELNWFRIVLDEAHMIREQSTLQSRAICRLQANRRWAVTGTPVQNKLDDLGALLKFLRITPFDEKRGFAQYILAPCKNADPEILPKLRLLVDSITLRRLKDRIDLPARHDQLIRLRFSRDEQRLYDIFAKNAHDRVAVLTKETKGLGGRAYVHILQSILRLRLICAHGKELLGEEDLKILAGFNKASAIDLDSDDEADKPALDATQAYDAFNLMRETNADTCALCSAKIGPQDAVDTDGEPKDETIGHMAPCFQLLCNGCFDDYKASNARNANPANPLYTKCVSCTQEIKMSYFALKQGRVEDDENARSQIRDTKHAKVLGDYNGPHTKTRALLQDLLQSRDESLAKPDEPPIKSIVFSGWTSHLDLISIALTDAEISHTRLDGKMSRPARTAAMDNFRTDASITVMLVSITAGGLGLNLTTANKVYVMEPQYNPAAEAQAIDRVHRLGQKREVWTTRYIMEDSFEEKMLELQDKKRKLASLSMDRDKERGGGRGLTAQGKEDAARKKLEDLRSLFK